MATGSADTQQGLVQLIGEAYGMPDLDAFRRGILTVLREVVPADIASYNEVADEPEQMWGVSEPEDLDAGAPLRWARLAHEHPVLAYNRRTHDGRPYRISDFLDADSFHATALYREFYAPLGVETQLSLTLPSSPPLVVAIALSRGPEDFSDDEVELLAQARPHLIQAYRTLELSDARAATLSALASGLDDASGPVLVVDRRGRITFATDAARRLLEERYGDGSGTAARLPPALVSALARRRQREAPATEPLVLGERDGNGDGPDPAPAGFTVRVLPGPDGDGTDVLLFEPGNGGLSTAALRGLGLTAREAEVLRWTALGRAAPDIATLLGISARTVEKHRESVYAKLGVSSRSQAAATAWAAVGVRHPRLTTN